MYNNLSLRLPKNPVIQLQTLLAVRNNTKHQQATTAQFTFLRGRVKDANELKLKRE